MSDEDADWAADDYVPKFDSAPTDKWAGEDEEDEVKDNWDDEDDGEKDNESENGENKAIQVKKKKTLAEKIAEREAKQLAALKRREEIEKTLTPEEEEEEKLRRKKLQEDADLQLAKEAFGININNGTGNIDTASPQTKEDFDKFNDMLREKITEFEKSEHYVGFLDALYRDLAINLEAEDIKKLGNTLTSLGSEKSKVQKAGKSKKGKKKATLNAGKGAGVMEDFGDGGDYAIYDDFM